MIENKMVNETTKSDVSLLSRAYRDLIVLACAFTLIMALSYYFHLFLFIVRLFQKHPHTMSYIDEIIIGLLTLSIGFSIFAWRRLSELRKAAREQIASQKKMTDIAQIQAEAERIINKQLKTEIDVLMDFLREDREILISKIQNNTFKKIYADKKIF